MGGPKTYFKKWKKLFRQQKGWDKVLGTLATARPGTRAWPNQSKDHKISTRLDFGALFVRSDGRQYRIFVLQPNRAAKDPGMAALAKKDSHQQLATVSVLVDNPPNVEDFMMMLGESLESTSNKSTASNLRRSRSLPNFFKRK